MNRKEKGKESNNFILCFVDALFEKDVNDENRRILMMI